MLKTEDFAHRFGVKSASVRRRFCIKGHYFGLKPIKLPNGRLLWPDVDPAQFGEKKNERAER